MAVRKDIKYINKDFTELRNQLINYSQTYLLTRLCLIVPAAGDSCQGISRDTAGSSSQWPHIFSGLKSARKPSSRDDLYPKILGLSSC